MSFRRRLFCSHGSGGARRRSTAAAETGTRVPVVSMCRSEWRNQDIVHAFERNLLQVTDGGCTSLFRVCKVCWLLRVSHSVAIGLRFIWSSFSTNGYLRFPLNLIYVNRASLIVIGVVGNNYPNLGRRYFMATTRYLRFYSIRTYF
ncbi:uncharacterized protein LOC110880039 [Helianthus annuus]|uniref:uncharacterized protein LOC110880039 n=1 Tax=Helianthus annuus TaxID=4232 RepID=UPI001652E136|nr:uncharacterized protein LOC110880039 [Helianthus annuus]